MTDAIDIVTVLACAAACAAALGYVVGRSLR